MKNFKFAETMTSSTVCFVLVCAFSLPTFANSESSGIFRITDKLEDVTNEILNENSAPIDKAFNKTTTEVSNFWKTIDQLSWRIGFNQTIDLLEGLGLSIGYKYGVEPSYLGGYFSRLDGYKVGLPISVTDWFLDDKTPWLLRVDPSVEMKFIQQFPSAEEARKITNGYTPLQFPITAQRAIDNLKPGDYVYTRARLAVLTRLSGEWELASWLEGRLEAAYVLSGLFDIFVFRAEDNKIRLRLLGRREHDANVKGEIGVEDDFDIFGVEVVDNALVNWTHIDELAMYKAGLNKQTVFLGDYTLDLNYPEVREAYDQLFARALLFKDVTPGNHLIGVIDPRKDNEDLRNIFISNLTRLDELYFEDLLEKDHTRRRVDRDFAGSNFANGKPREYKYGITGVYRVEDYAIRRDNRLTRARMNPDGTRTREYYLFPSWSHTHQVRALVSLFKETSFKSASFVYRANEQFVPTAFDSIAFYAEYTDKKYENSEHQDILKQIQQNLPGPVYDNIRRELEQKDFLSLPNMLKNVRVSARYFVQESGLRAIEEKFKGKSRDQVVNIIRTLIIEHMSRVPAPMIMATGERPNTGNGKGQARQAALSWCPRDVRDIYEGIDKRVARYCVDIEKITKNLAVAIDIDTEPLTRTAAVDKLIANKLYKKIGAGLTYAMLPEEAIATSAYVDLRFYTPSSVEPITVTFGEEADLELYESLLDIQNMMDEQFPDMRLFGDEENLTHRKGNPNDGD